MLGQMMDQPLLISSIARHADRRFADQKIVSFTVDNPRHRYTYRDAFSRPEAGQRPGTSRCGAG